MSDICFDLSGFSFATDNASEARESIANCHHSFEKLSNKAQGEVSAFNTEGARTLHSIKDAILEVRDEISTIENKRSQAQGKKREEKPMPQRPSISSNATPEQRNSIESAYQSKVEAVQKENERIRKENERIDEYVKKCEEAISKLGEIIDKLHRLEERTRSAISHAVSTANEFSGKAFSINAYGSRVNSAMGEFIAVFDRAYESAQRLYEMSPSRVEAYAFVDRQFTIKNTHVARVSAPTFVDFTSEDEEVKVKNEVKAKVDEELLIRTRNEEEFFNAISGASRIKMPSANLHRLGGKGFIAKMNSYGYELALQPDGSSMDINGMIHWEKKNV